MSTVRKIQMPSTSIPADDPNRNLVVTQPETDANLPHLGVVGDTYTILLSGKDTAGRGCLLANHGPPGGGPPPHPPQVEKMFTTLGGENRGAVYGRRRWGRGGETGIKKAKITPPMCH